MLNTCHGWGISARAHVQTALLYLRNGSADWVQFWCVSWGSWTRRLTQVKGGVSLHVRTCRPHFCISGTARPIGFNFGVWDGGHELGASHKSWVGYLCTCARADRTSVSQDRLGRLCSNLVCGLGVTKYVLSTSHGWNGASLHMRTCTPPPTPSGSDWPILLKFDVWIETQWLPPYLRIWLTNFVKMLVWIADTYVDRPLKNHGLIVFILTWTPWLLCHGFAFYEIYKSRRWGDCTFARASPISLSRKPLSLDIEATPKTDLSLSGSLVHRQTWRLTGYERRIRPSEFIFN